MNWKAGQSAKGSICQITNLQNLQNVLFTKVLFNCQVCSNSCWKGNIFETTFEYFCSFILQDFMGVSLICGSWNKPKWAEGLEGRGAWSLRILGLWLQTVVLPSPITFHPLSYFLPLLFVSMSNMAVQRGLWIHLGPRHRSRNGKKGRRAGQGVFLQGVGLIPREREDSN